MQRDDVFEAAWGGGASWEARLADHAKAWRVEVREAQEQAIVEFLPVLQRLARAYGEAAALGTLQRASGALQQWARTHPEIAA